MVRLLKRAGGLYPFSIIQRSHFDFNQKRAPPRSFLVLVRGDRLNECITLHYYYIRIFFFTHVIFFAD